MATFLQFVCERLLGPPIKGGGSEGEAYWLCPFHNDRSPSLHTLPHRPGTKDYWKCFGCGLWGDEFNLLRNLRDIVGLPEAQGNYADHQTLLHLWRQEYDRLRLNGSTERGKAQAQAPKADPGKCSSTSVESLRRSHLDDPRTVALAWANLSDAERDAVMMAFDVTRREGVAFGALGVYCLDFAEFVRRTDESHREQVEEEERRQRVIERAFGKAGYYKFPARNGRKSC